MSAKVATKGKHSAPGEGNIYARANLATAKVTAADTNGAFEVFDEQCKRASSHDCTCTLAHSRPAT